MGWMIGDLSPGRGWEFLSSPPCPDQLWGPPSLLSKGYQGQGVKLTTHPNLVPKSRMCRVIHPIPPYTFMAWCAVKAQGQLYLYLLPLSCTIFSSTNSNQAT